MDLMVLSTHWHKNIIILLFCNTRKKGEKKNPSICRSATQRIFFMLHYHRRVRSSCEQHRVHGCQVKRRYHVSGHRVARCLPLLDYIAPLLTINPIHGLLSSAVGLQRTGEMWIRNLRPLPSDMSVDLRVHNEQKVSFFLAGLVFWRGSNLLFPLAHEDLFPKRGAVSSFQVCEFMILVQQKKCFARAHRAPWTLWLNLGFV